MSSLQTEATGGEARRTEPSLRQDHYELEVQNHFLLDN